MDIEAAIANQTAAKEAGQGNEGSQEGQDGSGGITLLQIDRVKAMREARHIPGGVVSWSPPQQNWNTWMGCNIGKALLINVNICMVIVKYFREKKI